MTNFFRAGQTAHPVHYVMRSPAFGFVDNNDSVQLLFCLFRGTDVAQSEVTVAIERIEQRQNQSRQSEQERGGKESHPARSAGKKLQPIQQPPGEQAEVAADRMD